MSEQLLLITPVRNEAAHIARVIAGVEAQTRPPDRWIVIDDGSTDDTLAVLQRADPRLPFLTVLRNEARGNGADGLDSAAEAVAFNNALETTSLPSYTHVGKLDGDIELPPRYIERLLEEFDRNKTLGLVGGGLVERVGSDWRRIAIPSYHVHGAVKLYSRACFEAIGGIQERLGWDTIDETYARMKGFSTRTLDDLTAVHHRPWGSADGRLRGRARHGVCAYVLRYPPHWVALRSFKVARYRPVGLSGLAFAYGYARAALKRHPKVEDDAFKRFVRAELRRRLIRAGSSPEPGPLTS